MPFDKGGGSIPGACLFDQRICFAIGLPPVIPLWTCGRRELVVGERAFQSVALQWAHVSKITVASAVAKVMGVAMGQTVNAFASVKQMTHILMWKVFV